MYSRFCKKISDTSTGVPALLPAALQSRQARGASQKQFTKPTVGGILSPTVVVPTVLYVSGLI